MATVADEAGRAPAGMQDEGRAAAWRDGKRYAWLLGLFVPTLPFLAWGLDSPTPYRIAARELLRDTLLDAAREELRRRSWSEVTMADVARAAGLSRQTLYKEFGSRDEFARAFVMRETDRFLVAVEQALRERCDDPQAAIRAAFEVFLAAAGEHPLVRSILFEGAENGLLALVTTRGEKIVGHATERLAGILASCWPELAPRNGRPLAECLVRLGISYATLPAASVDEAASAVSALLAPYLARAAR